MRPDARGRYGVGAAALVAFLVGTFAHVESLSYWFASSDSVPLVETARVAGPGDLVRVFTGPMLEGTRFVEFALFYRPLSTLTYTVDHWLWGLQPAGYHLTNVLLHGGAAAIATVALVTVTRRRAVGVIGGFLFAAHPLTAEVVPAASRRHDVLMTIFVLGALTLFVRSRGPERGRSLAGAVGLYALALLAKEPALVFPGLVVAWVALEWERPWRGPALRAAGRAAAPFVAVTVLYLAVRVAVLGEVGGYKARGLPTAYDLLVVLVEYPLALGYPHGVVGTGTIPGAGVEWQSVLVAMGLVAVATLAAAAVTIRDRGVAAPSVAALGCAAAIVAVPVAFALEPAIREGILYDYGKPTIVWSYARPSSPVVGLLLVGALLGGSVWAATERSSALTASDRRALLFFGAWLAGPLVLFLRSGNFTPRSGYASMVPAVGAFALLAVAGVDGLRAWAAGPRDALPAADVAMVGVALLLVVPLAATSPLIHDYESWGTAGRVNEATLTGIQGAVEGTPDGTNVTVDGMVRILADRGCRFPRAKTLQFARPGTAESWLRIHGEQRRVHSVDDTVIHDQPTRMSVEGEIRDGNVTVIISYEGIEKDESCGPTPWERY